MHPAPLSLTACNRSSDRTSFLHSSPFGLSAEIVFFARIILSRSPTRDEPLGSRKASALFFPFPRRADGWVLYWAHCPSTFRLCAGSEHEHPPVRSAFSSLPACHLIPLLLQTPGDKVRVGLIRLRGTDGCIE